MFLLCAAVWPTRLAGPGPKPAARAIAPAEQTRQGRVTREIFEDGRDAIAPSPRTDRRRVARRMKRTSLILGIVLTALMVALSAVQLPLLGRAQDAVFDTYQRAAPRSYDPDTPVHIVDIDEAALAAYGQWPWPRSYMAALTDRLFDLGAIVVGFDVLFPEPDRTSPERIAESWARFAPGIPPALPDLGLPPHDTLFAAAIADRPVVLGLAGANDGIQPEPKAGIAVTGGGVPGILRFPSAVGNLPELTGAARGLGTISLGVSPDGITRTVPMVTQIGDALVPAFSAEIFRVVQGAGGHVLRTTEASGEASGGTQAAVAMQTGGVQFPLEADGRFRVYFSGFQPERVTPVARVLEGTADDAELRARIEGRMVLVGSSAQGLFDIRTTPLDGQIAGVTLHAEIIEQIVAQDFLLRPDWMWGLEVLLIVLMGAALTLLHLSERPLHGLGAVLAMVAACVALGVGLFAWGGLLFDPILPILTVLMVYIPGTTLGFIAKDRARRSIRARFAYFLPPDLLGRIEENPEDALTPGGAERDLSVIFVDIRSFSTVTEGMAPDRVVVLVNTYLSNVADALVAQGATIDKFMGDAVMAFWNAPIEREDHAAAAIRAIPAVAAAAAQTNIDLAREGLPELSVGIGVNTGPASVGLMGSQDRLNYTCIGDSVTLAARLEGLTRIYGMPNCVGPRTVEDLPEGFRAICLDLVAAKGFATAVPVYLVMPEDTDGLSELAERLERARAQYLARNWAAAEQSFAELAQLSPGFCEPRRLAAIYLERIEGFYRAPPPADWTGAAQALSKR